MADKLSHSEQLDAFSWQLLLPVSETHRVLVIDPPDAGQLAACASLFGHVTSVSSHRPCIDRQSAASVGCRKHIREIRGSALSLPFADRSFDLVIANNFRDDRNNGEHVNWRSHHVQILQNLYRVLATNGCISVFTRNRLDYRKILTGSNESPLRTSRSLSNMWRAYRRLGSLYLSPHQNLSAIRGAGFSQEKAYIAFPDCGTPRFVVPFDANVHRYFRCHFTYPDGNSFRKIAAKLLASSAKDRFLESHLLITGVKN